MEQIRIAKEMRERERANGRTGWMVRPRYMVWENVPGAFSSGNPKGADFAAVIEEIIKVAEPGAAVSVCVPNGGWTKSGRYYAEDGSWSVAWRVHDAQFWGVPQRRKRIALVADFGGLSAPEILFERKGLSRDSEPCGAPGEETAGAVGGSSANTSGAMNPWDSQSARVYPDNGVWHSLNANENGGQSRDSVFCLQGNGIDRADTAGCNGKGWCEDVSYTLNTIDRPAVAFGCDVYNQEITGDVAASLTAASGGTNTSGPKVLAAGFSFGQSAKARSIGFEVEVSPTLRGGEGGNQKPCVYDAIGNGDGKTVCTITGDHQNRVTDYTALCVGNGQANQSVSDKAGTLNTMHDQQAVLVPDVAHALKAKANVDFRADSETYPVQNSVVRRLTPLECERLQGYPDGWTSLNPISDMSDEDYAFWQNVLFEKNVRSGRIRQNEEGVWEIWRVKKIADPDGGDEEEDEWENTHKPYKQKTMKQMIAWYNRSFAGDSDSARYKALGNSIALPFWQWMARRICAQYERPATMASLFDGIGGFPLVFSRAGAVPVWASEIEEFPIAVTKVRFPDESV